MSDIIDARGLACPGPVLETRKALSDPDVIVVSILVDNEAAVENVGRMARSQGCTIKLESDTENEFKLVITRGDASVQSAEVTTPKVEQDHCLLPSNVAVLISSNTLGRGDDDLGRLLMIAFVKTLKELVPRPNTVLLMNSGVKLAVKESELLEALIELENMKVEIFVCGTCLDFFKIKDSLAVGKISNMFEISSHMIAADKVLRP